MAAAETISHFKHLGALLSPRQGHARVRRAPRDLSLQNCSPDFPFPVNSASPAGNPGLPSSASDQGFQFSHMGRPSTSNYGSGSTIFEECGSVGVDEEEQSIRGGSHLDLNNQIGSYDYTYEGSINSKLAKGAFHKRDNYSKFEAINHDNYNNNPKLDVNYSISSVINDNNPSCFDLNHEAPSLDSTSQANNYVLLSSNTKPPLFSPQPIMAFPPPSQENFSFPMSTPSVAVVSPSLPVRSTASDAPSGNVGHNQQASLAKQLAQFFSTNPHLEKAAANMVSSTTPTHSSHPSCLSVEGNLLTNGKLPLGTQPQPANNMAASMEEQMIKASSANLVKRKCPSSADDSNLTKCSNSPSKCHCSKSRKLKKKSIVRVPAISDKIAEIPQDEHSWRKYGQKPIKGSPYPRGYYKCSGVKGCPAKKHVERASDDPNMLIITYEGDHIHSRPMVVEPLQN